MCISVILVLEVGAVGGAAGGFDMAVATGNKESLCGRRG